jgi:hypothetical protein
MTIDRKMLRSFNADALEALKAVAAKHGVTIEQKNGSFARDGSNATVKFELATVGSDGQAQTKGAQSFKQNAALFGIDPNALGTTFMHQGTEYRITGLVTRRPKYPVSAERVSDGRSFKFPSKVVSVKARGLNEGLTPEIKREFGNLANALSPENLHCDGEITAAQARKKHARIMMEWRALEARVGRKVDESETYAW